MRGKKASDAFAGLALWLVPTLAHEQDTLQQEMDSLRLANADCSSAAFPPHVTLVAGISETESEDSESAVWHAFLEGLARWREDNKGSTIPLNR